MQNVPIGRQAGCGTGVFYLAAHEVPKPKNCLLFRQIHEGRYHLANTAVYPDEVLGDVQLAKAHVYFGLRIIQE
ncbi:hypothetical protein ES703_88833 [subsurface metagenome]